MKENVGNDLDLMYFAEGNEQGEVYPTVLHGRLINVFFKHAVPKRKRNQILRKYRLVIDTVVESDPRFVIVSVPDGQELEMVHTLAKLKEVQSTSFILLLQMPSVV